MSFLVLEMYTHEDNTNYVLPFAGDGRVPGHGLRRNFEI